MRVSVLTELSIQTPRKMQPGSFLRKEGVKKCTSRMAGAMWKSGQKWAEVGSGQAGAGVGVGW